MSTTAVTKLDHYDDAEVAVYWNANDFISLDIGEKPFSRKFRLSKRDAVAICMDLHRAAEATHES